jgi:hypothetical protein
MLHHPPSALVANYETARDPTQELSFIFCSHNIHIVLSMFLDITVLGRMHRRYDQTTNRNTD